jgi:hypothetical protein
MLGMTNELSQSPVLEFFDSLWTAGSTYHKLREFQPGDPPS